MSRIPNTALPKKFLHIRELTFILPDDFDGTLQDAMTLFLEYRSAHRKDAKFVDPNGLISPLQCLLTSNREDRVCGDEAIYQLKEVDGNPEYVLMDATNPYYAEKNAKRQKELQTKNNKK